MHNLSHLYHAIDVHLITNGWLGLALFVFALKAGRH